MVVAWWSWLIVLVSDLSYKMMMVKFFWTHFLGCIVLLCNDIVVLVDCFWLP
jgi:hypothetical protein